MHITKKNLLGICLLFFELIPIAALSIMPLSQSIDVTMRRIGIIALICFVITIIILWYNGKVLNAFIYFIVFAYLFSFGQCYMAISGQEIKNSAFSISNGFFSSEALIHSASFVLMSIMITCVGFLLYYSSSESGETTLKSISESYYLKREERARKVGWITMALGIAPTFITLFQEYRILLTSGYASTLVAATGTARILELVSGYFISGLLLLYCYEKKHRKLLYIIILAYIIAQLAGGSRFQVFRIAIIILLLEDLYFKKMDRRRWVIVIMISIIAIYALSLISSIRNYIYLSNDIGLLISTSLKNLWDNNFLVAAINEMGNTQVINTLVLDKCPNPVPFQYGLSFVKILWAIIPNFIGSAYTGYIGVDLTFSPLYTVTNSGMGASYISEGYWNFGYFSLIYFIIFGVIFGYLVTLFGKMCKEKSIDPGKFFLVVYIIYYILFLVRSEALGIGRSFVYYALVPYLCMNIGVGYKKE